MCIFGHSTQTLAPQIQTLCSCCLGIMDICLYFGGHTNSSSFSLNCAGVRGVCVRRSKASEQGSSHPLTRVSRLTRVVHVPYMAECVYPLYYFLVTMSSLGKASTIFHTALKTYTKQQLLQLLPSSSRLIVIGKSRPIQNNIMNKYVLPNHSMNSNRLHVPKPSRCSATQKRMTGILILCQNTVYVNLQVISK